MLGLASYAPNLIVSAKKYNLDPLLVAAIICQESSGDPSERRLENGFYRRYIRPMNGRLDHFVPENVAVGLEEVARSTSWGLMQIMGQTARMVGFKGDSLADLLYPSTNLDVGCRYFRQLLNSQGESVPKALLKWNGGGEPKYPALVQRHIDSGAAHRLLGLNKP